MPFTVIPLFSTNVYTAVKWARTAYMFQLYDKARACRYSGAYSKVSNKP